MAKNGSSAEFFEYLIKHSVEDPENPQLPSLNALSDELGVSVACLREQLGVAKALGWVEVRPRTGIKHLPYSFYQAVWQSLSYAINIDHKFFETFADLRKQVELAYWEEAVRVLTPRDIDDLWNLVEQANVKLQGNPIRIPHSEHRELHLSIYQRLNNPFVLGILEAYWDAYEAIGLSLFTDLRYLEEVWMYHRKMVEAICQGDFDAGFRALAEHTDLLRHRRDGYQD
ncbi:MAG: FCD domain-containing protein [Anaerolineales bacterium]|nr:FCD domain-containing protein [Anaerolineales bacterium]